MSVAYKAIVLVRSEWSTHSGAVGSHLLEFPTRAEAEAAIAKVRAGVRYSEVTRLYDSKPGDVDV